MSIACDWISLHHGLLGWWFSVQQEYHSICRNTTRPKVISSKIVTCTCIIFIFRDLSMRCETFVHSDHWQFRWFSLRYVWYSLTDLVHFFWTCQPTAFKAFGSSVSYSCEDFCIALGLQKKLVDRWLYAEPDLSSINETILHTDAVDRGHTKRSLMLSRFSWKCQFARILGHKWHNLSVISIPTFIFGVVAGEPVHPTFTPAPPQKQW